MKLSSGDMKVMAAFAKYDDVFGDDDSKSNNKVHLRNLCDLSTDEAADIVATALMGEGTVKVPPDRITVKIDTLMDIFLLGAFVAWHRGGANVDNDTNSSDSAEEQTKPPQQTTGPQCVRCGAFTTYARVKSHGLCMGCEIAAKAKATDRANDASNSEIGRGYDNN